MKHLGDITKISGYDAPVVDCIIGGSPCQDLSVAGKRAGLQGERSGLFMEQVRIVKEMREYERRNGVRADLIRPRYLVWENVVGAFSSNKGEDFKAVLEEIVRVSKEDAVIPMPKDRKWRTSGCIVGDGFSVAWRVHDAQYWGVPQRRRRICILADFNGDSAPYLLFGDSKQYGDAKPSDRDLSFGHLGDKSRSEVQPIGNGLQGYFEKSKKKGQGSSQDSSEGVGTNDYERRSFQRGADIYNLKMTDDKACSVTSAAGIGNATSPKVVEQVSFIDGWGGNMEKMFTDGKMNTIRSAQPQVVVREALSFQERAGKPGGGKGILIQDEKVGSLGTSPNQATVYSIENHPNDSRVKIDPTGKVQTLSQRMGTGGGNVPLVMEARTPALVVEEV